MSGRTWDPKAKGYEVVGGEVNCPLPKQDWVLHPDDVEGDEFHDFRYAKPNEDQSRICTEGFMPVYVEKMKCDECGRSWSEHSYGLVHSDNKMPKVTWFTICPEEDR